LNFIRRVLEREKRHPVLTYLWYVVQVAVCRARYRRKVRALRESGDRVRVAFLTAGASKWKCQSVYDEMVKSGRFDPVVVTDEEPTFYVGLGCHVREDGPMSGYDIVVYQDPWSDLASRHPVWELSRTALCCYVPYSIESIAQGGRSERFDYHHLANFHGLMFACFQWSEDYAKHYARQQWPWEWAGCTLGFGHPSLDPYCGRSAQGERIIYAPHFAFEYNGVMPISSIGTFPWSGEKILAYAQAHPEQKWLFKPHPKLRDRLVEIGYWSREQVEAYYQAWEAVGEVCYDGDYAKWFLSSRAMITDSNSFLMEYMAVGRPLIHLVPEKTNMINCRQAAELFETYYTVKGPEELATALEQVIERREDPREAEREAAAKRASILGNHAGRRIVTWLLGEIGGGGI